MSIINRIKELISEKGLTPYHISHETGISEAAISRILNNKTEKPNYSTIKKFASFFNVDPDWLYTGKGKKYLDNVTDTTDKYVNETDKDMYNILTGNLSPGTRKSYLINSIHIMARTAERNSISLEKLINYLDKESNTDKDEYE
ncbi:MAG TPA: hypothetical protein DEQ30_09430 [Porphyromonadaceae bacterium]|nr:hypothetical protein [Porphyromonadaceae bacterium]